MLSEKLSELGGGILAFSGCLGMARFCENQWKACSCFLSPEYVNIFLTQH